MNEYKCPKCNKKVDGDGVTIDIKDLPLMGIELGSGTCRTCNCLWIEEIRGENDTEIVFIGENEK